MIQIGKNIYANFSIKDIPQAVQQKVRALVMGRCGSGKTHLFNNLCGTRYQTEQPGWSQGSKTKEMDCQSVTKLPNNFFLLYDTPGTDAEQNHLQHSKVLKASLTLRPINLIIINEKIDARLFRNFKAFKAQMKIFNNCEKMVVLLISHLDTLDGQQKKKIFQLLDDQLKSMKQLKIILYSNQEKTSQTSQTSKTSQTSETSKTSKTSETSKTSDFQALAQVLFKLGQTHKQQNIQVNDNINILYKFLQNPSYSQDQEQYIQKIKDQANSFLDYINNFSQNNSQFISDVKQHMKCRLQQLQLSQQKEYSKKQTDNKKKTDFHQLLSSIIQSKLEQFDDISDKKSASAQQSSDNHDRASNSQRKQQERKKKQQNNNKNCQYFGTKLMKNIKRVDKDQRNQQKIQQEIQQEIKQINLLQKQRNIQLLCLQSFNQAFKYGLVSQFRTTIQSYIGANKQQLNPYLDALQFIMKQYIAFSQVQQNMVSYLKNNGQYSVGAKDERILSKRCCNYQAKISESQMQLNKKIQNKKWLQEQYEKKNNLITDKLNKWETMVKNSKNIQSVPKIRQIFMNEQHMATSQNQFSRFEQQKPKQSKQEKQSQPPTRRSLLFTNLRKYLLFRW